MGITSLVRYELIALITGVGVPSGVAVPVAVGVLVGVEVGVLVGSVARVVVGVGSAMGLKRSPFIGVIKGAGVKVGGSELGFSVGTRAIAVGASVAGERPLLDGVQAPITTTIRIRKSGTRPKLLVSFRILRI